MKILAHVHGYPPIHNAGAEWMLHSIMKFMSESGHETRVFSVRNNERSRFQDVDILGRITDAQLMEQYRWADVAITHLDRTQSAVEMAQATRKPLVHLVHNDNQLKVNRITPKNCQLAVMNSKWLSRHLNWDGHEVIVRPPVDYKDFKVRKAVDDRVTLINLFAPKGGELFWRLAKALPGVPFLGVKGSYGQQVIPTDIPPNVEVVENTSQIVADVYARTSVLLVPSSYESWGRVAVEAMSAGIPVIAHPTPGLLESLSFAGTFVDREDVDGWVSAIRALRKTKLGAQVADVGLYRAKQLDPQFELKNLEARLLELASSTITVMTNNRCSICNADACACGGSTVNGIQASGVVRKASRQSGPKKLYNVGGTTLRLSDFRAREMGVFDQSLDAKPVIEDDTEIEQPKPVANKARRTRTRQS